MWLGGVCLWGEVGVIDQEGVVKQIWPYQKHDILWVFLKGIFNEHSTKYLVIRVTIYYLKFEVKYQIKNSNKIEKKTMYKTRNVKSTRIKSEYQHAWMFLSPKLGQLAGYAVAVSPVTISGTVHWHTSGHQDVNNHYAKEQTQVVDYWDWCCVLILSILLYIQRKFDMFAIYYVVFFLATQT